MSTSNRGGGSRGRGRGRGNISRAGNPNSVKNAERQEQKAVVLKATGNAIETALGLGLYFQNQKDLQIDITTGTVECTDDVVLTRQDMTLDQIRNLAKPVEQKAGDDMEIGDELPEIDDEFPEQEDEFPSSTRNASMIAIAIRKKKS